MIADLRKQDGPKTWLTRNAAMISRKCAKYAGRKTPYVLAVVGTSFHPVGENAPASSCWHAFRAAQATLADPGNLDLNDLPASVGEVETSWLTANQPSEAIHDLLTIPMPMPMPYDAR